jgi:glycosyltransferase involved in cell wall biosynthesis
VAYARKVLLNALFLDPSASGGPETYLRSLAPALLQTRPDAELAVATTRRGAAALRASGWPGQGIAVHELACDEGERLRRQLAEQIMLPHLARQLGVDVLHSLASVAPMRVRGVAHVITLHDVNFIHHSTFNSVTSWGMRQVIPRAARHADALIAVSAVAMEDICETLDLSPDRFTVVHHGVEPIAPQDEPRAAETRASFNLGAGRVVLSLGAKRPHKNQALLVRAMPQLPDDVRVVLAGHAEPYEADVRLLAAELGVDGRVVFTEWVDDRALEGLWSVASVAAFPTLAEGFGLPVLEAMARGVPVAASDLPVFREIAGSWPLYFNPEDPSDAARAIVKLLDQPPDPGAGRVWAQRFSWTAAAEATWETYDRAATRHGPAERPS